MTLDNQHHERVRGAFAALVDAAPLGVEFDELSDVRSTASVHGVTSLDRRRGWLVAVVTAASVLVLVGSVAWLSGSPGPETPAATPPSVSSASLKWSRVPYDEAMFGAGAGYSTASVIAGGPGLVAVGGNNSVSGPGEDFDAVVWTSADGIAWSQMPDNDQVLGVPGDQEMRSVTAGGPGLVAVGHDWSRLYGARAAVWTSVDGITWSRVPHDEAVFSEEGVKWMAMASVTAGGPGLVAVGVAEVDLGDRWLADAAVWTSVDGITWSRVPHDEAVFGGSDDQRMSSVTTGGPGLVAVGTSGSDAAVWTSVDGITWSRVPHDEAVFGGVDEQSMLSVTVGGPGLVAVGWDGTQSEDHVEDDADAAVWTSVDGITWSRVPHDEAVFGGADTQKIEAVTVIGSDLVAVGRDGPGSDSTPPAPTSHAAVWTSVDGITWSRVPHDEAVFGGGAGYSMGTVTVGGPGLVATGQDGRGHMTIWIAVAED